MKNAEAWIAAGELTLWDIELSSARTTLLTTLSHLEAAAGLAARVPACKPFEESVQAALEDTRSALAKLQFDQTQPIDEPKQVSETTDSNEQNS
ncbi:MAG TPA: hypothetical protein VF773_11970 [Verrucomicrobiae bacterium]